MKRYILFHGARYYPGGGFKDDHEFFDGHVEAIERGRTILKKEETCYWAHIFDVVENRIIWDKDAEDIIDGE
jgi:hypothetical protein